MTGPSEDEARSFAAAFRSFLEWVHSDQLQARGRNEVVTVVGDFLGPDGAARSVVTRALPVFEHVNLQTALDAWSADAGRSVTVHGITIPPHHGFGQPAAARDRRGHPPAAAVGTAIG